MSSSSTPTGASRPDVDPGPVRRGRGDRGSAFVAALVVMFTVTGAAAIWLARDVNQRVSDRSALQSVAFQAARAGAQQLTVGDLRGDGSAELIVDPGAAPGAAEAAAHRLAANYDLDIEIVSQGHGDDPRTWTVRIGLPESGIEVTGVAHAESGN